MMNLGVPFDRDENGDIIVTREGGHCCRRILHCGGDATGKLMTKTLGEVVGNAPEHHGVLAHVSRRCADRQGRHQAALW